MSPLLTCHAESLAQHQGNNRKAVRGERTEVGGGHQRVPIGRGVAVKRVALIGRMHGYETVLTKRRERRVRERGSLEEAA